MCVSLKFKLLHFTVVDFTETAYVLPLPSWINYSILLWIYWPTKAKKVYLCYYRKADWLFRNRI